MLTFSAKIGYHDIQMGVVYNDWQFSVASTTHGAENGYHDIQIGVAYNDWHFFVLMFFNIKSPNKAEFDHLNPLP